MQKSGLSCLVALARLQKIWKMLQTAKIMNGQTCMLRLQKKPISEGTAKAIEAISSFLSMLANYYDKDRKGELKLDE